MDMAEKSVAMSSAVLTEGRLAAAGTTESLTRTGMREDAAREGMAADARLTESEMSCGIVMLCECKSIGSESFWWRRKRKREKERGKPQILIPENPANLLTQDLGTSELMPAAARQPGGHGVRMMMMIGCIETRICLQFIIPSHPPL